MAKEWIGGPPTGYTRVQEGATTRVVPDRTKAASSGMNKKSNTPKLKSPLFTDVSSYALLKQEKPSSVALLVGPNKEREVIIVIPAPTAKDIKIAKSLANKTTTARQKFIRKAIEDKNTWMVAYMCAVFREDNNDIGWFDPAHRYSFEWSSSRTVLQTAMIYANMEIAGLLLQTGNLLTHYNSVWPLVDSKNKEEAKNIFNLIRDYQLDIDDHNIRDVNDKEFRQMFADKRREMREQKAEAERVVQAEKKQKKLAEAAKAAENVIEDDNGVVWKRLDDSSISKVTEDGEGFRLRKVFNFKSGTVSETNEYLDKEGNVTTATSPTVTSFRSLSSRGEVKQAQEKLQSILDKQRSQEREARQNKPKLAKRSRESGDLFEEIRRAKKLASLKARS